MSETLETTSSILKSSETAKPALTIKLGGLEEQSVIDMLEEHVQDMYATSPPESVHTLDLNKLKGDDIYFWSAWRDNEAVGCIALKIIEPGHGELKSMRTTHKARGTGAGRALLNFVLEFAPQNSIHTLSLETGSMEFFQPARHLYRSAGFEDCGPFGDYSEDPYAVFMTKAV